MIEEDSAAFIIEVRIAKDDRAGRRREDGRADRRGDVIALMDGDFLACLSVDTRAGIFALRAKGRGGATLCGAFEAKACARTIIEGFEGGLFLQPAILDLAHLFFGACIDLVAIEPGQKPDVVISRCDIESQRRDIGAACCQDERAWIIARKADRDVAVSIRAHFAGVRPVFASDANARVSRPATCQKAALLRDAGAGKRRGLRRCHQSAAGGRREYNRKPDGRHCGVSPSTMRLAAAAAST